MSTEIMRLLCMSFNRIVCACDDLDSESTYCLNDSDNTEPLKLTLLCDNISAMVISPILEIIELLQNSKGFLHIQV